MLDSYRHTRQRESKILIIFFNSDSLSLFSTFIILLLRKPLHRVPCPNGSEWFDPAFLRDQKIWCLSESSAQSRQMMSLSKVTETSSPFPIKHIKCQRWMSVDFFRDESSQEVVGLIYKAWVSPQETCSKVTQSFYRTCLALTSHEHWSSPSGQITVQTSGGEYYSWMWYQKTRKTDF